MRILSVLAASGIAALATLLTGSGDVAFASCGHEGHVIVVCGPPPARPKVVVQHVAQQSKPDHPADRHPVHHVPHDVFVNMCCVGTELVPCTVLKTALCSGNGYC